MMTKVETGTASIKPQAALLCQGLLLGPLCLSLSPEPVAPLPSSSTPLCASAACLGPFLNFLQ